jgi:hypothetical protein
MNYKKIVIGGVVAGVVFSVVGWIVYTKILATYLAHHTGELGLLGRVHLKYEYLLLGNLLQGFLLAYIFNIAKINSLLQGLITGLITGLLVSSSYDLVMYGSTFILSKKGLLVDVIGFSAISTVVGAILGYANAKIKN